MNGVPGPVYEQCGLRIRSDIPLQLPMSGATTWDVNVQVGPDVDTGEPPSGEVIAVYGSGESNWYTATRTDEGFLVRFRRCGEFVISADLSAVEVRSDPTGRHELLPILMAGTVSGLLLALRGHTVLHASAVGLGSAAMAFVGQSGRGKSTVAALMCVDGAQLITDDLLTVAAGPPVSCLGGAGELRLREKAREIADRLPGAITRDTVDERLALAPTAAPPGPHGLAAIVIPSPSRTVAAVEVTRIEPSAALFQILAFPRVHGWSDPGVLSRDFAVLSAVVSHVPVYGATIPWGPPFDPAVARSLAALLDDDAASVGERREGPRVAGNERHR